MKKLCAVLLAVMMFASTAADAKGGRGSGGGRSFSRPSATKSHAPKRPTVKRENASKTTSSTSSSAPLAVVQTPSKREDKREDSESGGFWSTLFGSVAGSMAGNAIYDAITDDEKKEAAPPAPVEAKPAR